MRQQGSSESSSSSTFFFFFFCLSGSQKKKNGKGNGVVPPDRPRRGGRWLLRLRHAMPGAHRRQLPVRVRVPVRLQGRQESARRAH